MTTANIISIISWFAWLASCTAIGNVAQLIGRGFGRYFFLSFFLSPLIGSIILAIKGRGTTEEILNENAHIFYCSTCNSTYSSLGEKDEYCPQCGKLLAETTVLRDTWRGYSEDRKTKTKAEFANGQHMRNADVVNHFNSADELKKFKELLDMGAINQEEFDAKKKQLLGL